MSYPQRGWNARNVHILALIVERWRYGMTMEIPWIFSSIVVRNVRRHGVKGGSTGDSLSEPHNV
ncbi:MAG: hypothetical protein NWE83_05920 [Candidatus Bathyarchaeota archaeon]|nr:hypothetical protein [Candidatus Bathyarchaeota archaeon]